MPRAGVEPATAKADTILSRARLPIPPPGQVLIINDLEAWAGIEPAYKGFADPCLTTWLPGRFARITYFSSRSKHKRTSLGARSIAVSIRAPNCAPVATSLTLLF